MNNDTNIIYLQFQTTIKQTSFFDNWLFHLKLIFLLENSQFQNTILRNILKPLKTFDLFKNNSIRLKLLLSKKRKKTRSSRRVILIGEDARISLISKIDIVAVARKIRNHVRVRINSLLYRLVATAYEKERKRDLIDNIWVGSKFPRVEKGTCSRFEDKQCSKMWKNK